ncbi:hypothetical protein UVI_02036180 [Ustilaginoidea virens]|uniref:Efflux pump ustT n=1 Tax=Ustilaginoidea virens TaxID=1159556 RepID=USTT_USTVR|nr:RecName: Full=Efflux pump ustT; AltName: Full=Ustilaginoidins biosynthesis cluster protein T [Ustilaginoidea virens]GAO19110.1 hypothetical protein UVI_02036180 [Ustilaginoidea virens]
MAKEAQSLHELDNMKEKEVDQEKKAPTSVGDQEEHDDPKKQASHSQNVSENGLVDEAAQEAPEDESQYPGPLAMAVIMVAISMGMFLVSLLPLGRFYKFYSPKWVYMSLVFIFVIGSAVGAGAMNSNTVIVGRAIQGIGLGGVLSGSTILIAENAPLHRQPMFLGILMATMSISAIVGPLIGGALTTHTSWRWCFILNIPIGGAIIAVLFFFVKAREGKEQRAQGWVEKIRQLDPLGSALLLPAVVCLILALQWAGSQYSWDNWRIILLFVFGGLLSIGFVVSQMLRPDTATVPPHVVCQRTVFGSFLFSAMTGGAMLVVTYWISDWFQAVQNVSAAQAGIRTIALVLSQAVGAIMGGGSSRLIGYPPPIMMISATFIAVGAGLLTTLNVDTKSANWIGYQILMGLGLGFGTQQASLAVQTVLKKDDIPTAISLIFFGMQLGGSIFVCIGQNVFNQVFVKLLGQAAIPGLDTDLVLRTGATEIRQLVHNDADLSKLVTTYNTSVTSTFYVALAAGITSMLSAFLVQWKSVKNVEPVH